VEIAVMDQSLTEIAKLDGVRGVLVGDPSGRVFAHVGINLDDKRLTLVTGQMGLLFASLYAVGRVVEELDICYETVRLVARALHGTTLIVLCDPNVDIAMLRLTLNVVLARIKQDASIMNDLPGWERVLRQAVGDDIQQVYNELMEATGGEVNYV
jgi:hypothetical protein